MTRRPLLKTLAAAAVAGLFATAALAQAPTRPQGFPSQPIEYTVVYPAGGGMDVTARLLAKYAEKVSGDRIVVNNRTGGAGMVGHAYLAQQAKPDGYTVGIVANLLWGDAMLRAQGKWAYTDLEPIAYVNSDALTWVGPTEGALKGRSLKDVLGMAKDKPGTIRVATVPGSMWEYLVEQLETASGARFLRVPFQGGGAGITALVGGNVDIAQGFLAEYRGHLEAGKLAPLAVASTSRLPSQKDLATFNEALGGTDYVWNVIRFAVVPKGTPPDRKAYLGAVITAAMKDPELRAEYAKMGAYFDPSLDGSNAVAAGLEKYAGQEREFYRKTGRLK